MVPPEHLRFGGGAAETTIQPLWTLCLLIAVVLVLTLPRAKVVIPFLVAIFTIPFYQVVVLGGLHFTALRILIVAGLIRGASFRGSSPEGKYPGGFGAIDRAVVLWSISTFVVFCLEFMEFPVLINALGDLLDMLGGYVVVRFLIPDGEAVRRTIKTMAAICVIQGVCMTYEKIIGINVFGLLGGMPLAAAVRDGKIRAAGSLGALTAGPFAGVLIPLFIWLWIEGKSRMVAAVGFVMATTMVTASNSSTSWMALMGSAVGLGFWPLRRHMRLVRQTLVATLVGLHLVMKAPVWALIARVDLTGSSSGYHRMMLVDNCIRHFGDWWLLGYKYYNLWGWDMWDTCNQFVDVAVKGGLVTLVCYILIFTRSFGAIGKARKRVEVDRGEEWLLWCLGSSLFATVAAQFGIMYMAQLMMSFFPLIASICITTINAKQATIRTAEPLLETGLLEARQEL
jgi:hypothetical protein